MYISRKTQIVVTDYQKELIDEMIYVRRSLWNKIVETYNPTIIEKLKTKKKNALPSQTELEKFAKELYPDCSSRLLRSCAQDYVDSWKMCFKIPQRRKPTFHSCKKSEQSVPMYDCGTKIKKNTFTLSAKLGTKVKDKTLNFKEDLSKFNGMEVPVYSISRRNNKYYISLTFKINNYEKEKSQENQVGCDWGIKTFLTTSDGKQYDLPDKLIRQEIKIKNLQRILSNKSKGSKNWNKVKTKFNSAWLRYMNIRKDFIEKLSYELLSQNILVVLEDLDIQEMIKKSHKNRRKNIYKNSFRLFRDRIVQKSERFESRVVFVNRYFPSSQLCCKCNKRHEMTLNKRQMMCDCGNLLDRDLNAAINILKEGTRMSSMTIG